MLIKFAGALGVMIAAALITWFGVARRPDAPPAAPVAVEAPSTPKKEAATPAPATGVEAPAGPKAGETQVGESKPTQATPANTTPANTTTPGATASGTAAPDTATPNGAASAGPAPAATPQQQAQAAPAQAPAAAAAPTPPAAQRSPAASVPLPTFDIVRVEPSGDTVVAGQGMPGATVELMRNGSVYARSVADVGGQWAIVPPPLPKGAAELSLRVTTPDGRMALSEQVVTVRVPETPGEPVVVVLNAPDMPAKVLSDGTAMASADDAPQAPAPGKSDALASKPAPVPAAPAAPAPSATAEATPPAPVGQQVAAGAPAAPKPRANAVIQAVEADDQGRFFVTGKAEPGADIRIYLNEAPVATVKAAKDGGFGLTVEKGMAPGSYAVRADDVDAASGKVLTRAEVPFVMEARAKTAAPAAVVTADAGEPKPVTQGDGAGASQPAGQLAGDAAAEQGLAPGKADSAGLGPGPKPATPAAPDSAPTPSVAVVPELKTVTIVRGDNLWRISRKTYGQGIRYTVIYDANVKQIRNPNLIYPGQIFVMPEAANP
jgi:nucleoid-associated protein YgaU